MGLFGYNFKKIERKFIKSLYKITRVRFKSRTEKGFLSFYANVPLPQTDIKMLVLISVYKKGGIYITCGLGEIQPTPEVLKIINDYHLNASMSGALTLSIDEENELQAAHYVATSSSRSFKKHIRHFFGVLVVEDSLEILKKLIPLIKSKN